MENGHVKYWLETVRLSCLIYILFFRVWGLLESFCFCIINIMTMIGGIKVEESKEKYKMKMGDDKQMNKWNGNEKTKMK